MCTILAYGSHHNGILYLIHREYTTTLCRSANNRVPPAVFASLVDQTKTLFLLSGWTCRMFWQCRLTECFNRSISEKFDYCLTCCGSTRLSCFLSGFAETWFTLAGSLMWHVTVNIIQFSVSCHVASLVTDTALTSPSSLLPDFIHHCLNITQIKVILECLNSNFSWGLTCLCLVCNPLVYWPGCLTHPSHTQCTVKNEHCIKPGSKPFFFLLRGGIAHWLLIVHSRTYLVNSIWLG